MTTRTTFGSASPSQLKEHTMSESKHRFVVTTTACEQLWMCNCMADSAEEAIEVLKKHFPEAPVELRDALDLDAPFRNLNYLFREVIARQRECFADGYYASFCD